ncbi:MAG TPA: hypothetical protein VK665_01480, partial [Candidatus Elarobacter sp.]|nr:hypothetical protein [Candidatus Elarobacter sp.]
MAAAVHERTAAAAMFDALRSRTGLYYYEARDNGVALGLDYYVLDKPCVAYASWRRVVSEEPHLAFTPDRQALHEEWKQAFSGYAVLFRAAANPLSPDDVANG